MRKKAISNRFPFFYFFLVGKMSRCQPLENWIFFALQLVLQLPHVFGNRVMLCWISRSSQITVCLVSVSIIFSGLRHRTLHHVASSDNHYHKDYDKPNNVMQMSLWKMREAISINRKRMSGGMVVWFVGK